MKTDANKTPSASKAATKAKATAGDQDRGPGAKKVELEKRLDHNAKLEKK